MMRILALVAAMLIGAAAYAQGKVSFSTSLGVGVDMSRPSNTPFEWQIGGCYNFNGHISAGIGTGISTYEEVLIPLFAQVGYRFGGERRVSPFVVGCAGYSLAPSGAANGGLYVSPAAGASFALSGRLKMFASVGYEVQKLERLKVFENSFLMAEYVEKLSHNAIALRIGLEL